MNMTIVEETKLVKILVDEIDKHACSIVCLESEIENKHIFNQGALSAIYNIAVKLGLKDKVKNPQ